MCGLLDVIVYVVGTGLLFEMLTVHSFGRAVIRTAENPNARLRALVPLPAVAPALVSESVGVTTVTVAVAVAVPPAPVIVRVYVVVTVGLTVSVPPVPTGVPFMFPLVPFVLLYVSVEDCPGKIEVGEALNDAVGAGVYVPSVQTSTTLAPAETLQLEPGPVPPPPVRLVLTCSLVKSIDVDSDAVAVVLLWFALPVASVVHVLPPSAEYSIFHVALPFNAETVAEYVTLSERAE